MGTDLGDSETVLESQPRGMGRTWGLGTQTNSPTIALLCDFGEAAFVAAESHAAGRC